MTIQEYRNFIAAKAVKQNRAGMQPVGTNDKAKAHQSTALIFRRLVAVTARLAAMEARQ